MGKLRFRPIPGGKDIPRPVVQSQENILSSFRGGPGSGHWGHRGRPGKVGGSLPGGGLHLLFGRSTLLGREGLDLPKQYERRARESLAKAMRDFSHRETINLAPSVGSEIENKVDLSYLIGARKEVFETPHKNLGEQLWTLAGLIREATESAQSGKLDVGQAVARLQLLYAWRARIVGSGLEEYIMGMKGDSSFNLKSVQEGFKPYSLPIAMRWVNERIRARNPIDISVFETTKDRAFHRGRDEIHIRKDSSTATIIHEIGHCWETQLGELRQVAMDFLEHRTKGEPTVSLRALHGPESGYEENEMAKPDRFYDPYVGKRYEYATEVISMGLGGLWDPVWSGIMADPGHVALTLAMMEGKFV